MAAEKTEQSNIDNIRHSLAHLLATAVLKKYPDAKLGIGPTIEHGFYYDFLLSQPLSPEDLKEFQKEMKKMIGRKLAISGEELSIEKAGEIFKDQPFKIELIEDLVKEQKQLTAYHTGDAFTDLCRGGHVENTSEINADAFKLTSIAGAYWKGDEKNKQLQRIYGLAFETKQELDAHLAMLEETKKRDHKKLGQELDLFVFSELVGSGLPLWTPKGTLIRNILDNFVWQLRKERGYQQVDIPHIAKRDLYEKSGHWQKFSEELFKINTREGHLFVMKPMNCPHHIQIYDRKPHSYRELPDRYANTTKVYRDEQTGELSGLARVRSITQDDAHVFCRNSQVREEFLKVWDIIEIFYGKIGFDLRVRLSFHDPKVKEKYLGSPELWENAEHTLRTIAKEKNATAYEAQGEAAFYGPKVDFMATDSLGREWQVATIQLDMNLPERFDLNCINEKGEKERIVMIHAAIMGSLERFMSVLIEHFAGAFPFWLAPVQVAILPINDKNEEYVRSVTKKLDEKNIRYEVDPRNESIGKKIRESEMQKIPFTLVIGDKEATDNTVAIRERGKGDLGTMSADAAIEKMLS